MNFKESQLDMRKAYYSGGPGVLASGLVWLGAGTAAFTSTEWISILIFFFGGMLIHPLGIAFSKGFKRSGKHQKDNPLAYLAIESTVVLFMGLFLAYVLFQVEPAWFFPTMLLTIGARYILFQTLYGIRIYWALGAILILAGVGCFIFSLPFYTGAFVGGALELIFSLLILRLQPNN